MRDPIPWRGLCFVHVSSNDVCHEYALAPDGASVGRLVQGRVTGIWLAYFRGVCGSESPEKHQAFEDEKDVARRALDQALRRLKARVKADRAWLLVHEDDFA